MSRKPIHKKDSIKSLPHFIIIGAMKAGTTSLYHYLNLHPEISMSKTKETNFFCECNFMRGLEWYGKMFPDNDNIKGEASTNYSKFPSQEGVPERIYNTLPGVKLIYILRDPIDRLLSHLHHNLLKGDENEEEYMEKLRNPGSHYVNCSRYYMQLEQYFPYFEKDQFLILTAEELRNSQEETVKKAFRFLNLKDPDYYHPKYHKSRHTSYGRRKILHPTIRKLLKDKPYYNFIAGNFHFLIPTKVIKKPTLPQDVLDHLQKIFREDVRKLKEFTGRSFEEWSYDYE